MHDCYKSVVNEMVVNACDVPVYEVVVELQHSQFRVLVYEEPDVEGKVVRQACLVRRYLVGVVGDGVQLSKALVVDTRRRPESFIVSAMIALSGSASPSRRAADTDSPNCRKHGFPSYSTIWYTRSTTRPCARYHCRSGVASRIFFPW